MYKLTFALSLALVACQENPGEVVFACDTYSCVPDAAGAVGDPEAGRIFITETGANRCGFPADIDLSVLDPSPAPPLEGRQGGDEDLPFFMTETTSARGESVVNINCLACHGGSIRGEMVPGLPNHAFESAPSEGMVAASRLLAQTEAQHTEIDVMERLSDALAPYSLDTVGANPGITYGFVGALHRDPDTYAWIDPSASALPPAPPIPLDPSPWWGMSKKNAMFWNTAVRGDYTPLIASAFVGCIENEEVAADLADNSPDVRAWLESTTPPPWPWAVDADLAETGELLFRDQCARCHGTYDGDGEYPNVVVPAGVVGTDSALADERSMWEDIWTDQYAQSAIGDGVDWAPQAGYIAPPLDGIWATAPYFHNGSVPTIAAVLDPSLRPVAWARIETSGDEYDRDEMGWPYDEVDPDDAEPSDYDTTAYGFGNGGHPFGEVLNDSEKRAVMEYLKTI